MLGLQNPSPRPTDRSEPSATHTHSILDNDGPPGFSAIDAPSATEESGSLVFTVGLSAAPGQTVTVDYATADGTALAAGSTTPR